MDEYKYRDNCFVLLRPDAESPITLAVVGVVVELCLPHVISAWPIFYQDRVEWCCTPKMLVSRLQYISLEEATKIARAEAVGVNRDCFFHERNKWYRHFLVHSGGQGRHHLGKSRCLCISFGTLYSHTHAESRDISRVIFKTSQRNSSEGKTEYDCFGFDVWDKWHLSEHDLVEITPDQVSRITETLHAQMTAFANHRQQAIKSIPWAPYSDPEFVQWSCE